jgi:hypothetical protein
VVSRPAAKAAASPGAGLLGCLVDPDAVEQRCRQPLLAAADGPQAAAGDEGHERADVPGGPLEQVVRQAGQHPGRGAGEDELPLGGLEQAAPLAAAVVGRDVEGRHAQPGPAAGGLGQDGALAGEPLGEEPPLGQADAGVDEGHGQLVGQPLEVVGADNLCHQAVFMNDTADAVTAPDSELLQADDAVGQRAQRRGLFQGSVRPVGVIEVLILAQHGHQVVVRKPVPPGRMLC